MEKINIFGLLKKVGSIVITAFGLYKASKEVYHDVKNRGVDVEPIKNVGAKTVKLIKGDKWEPVK